MTNIVIYDWYEGKDLVYKGTNIRMAKLAIRQFIEDTAAECSLTVDTNNDSVTKSLVEYIDTYMDYVREEL